MDLLGEINKDFNSYSTDDYYIASFPTTKGFNIITPNKNGKENYFLFNDKEKIEKILLDFYNRTEKVVTIDLITAISNIESMLHNI